MRYTWEQIETRHGLGPTWKVYPEFEPGEIGEAIISYCFTEADAAMVALALNAWLEKEAE